MPPLPPLKLGLVGFGKIARDEHLPAIAGTEDVRLVAVATRHGQAVGVANYHDIEVMVREEPGLDAVIMCQPPQPRYDAARIALHAGKHVFLEKPPGPTVCEVAALAELARAKGVTLFATWHSRHAAGVAQARAWLQGGNLRSGTITWKEDVRQSHPGQAWIFEAGGFGVFDTGINALSILTEVVREPIRVRRAELEVPANRAAPIAAAVTLEPADGAPIEAAFDFRQSGPPTWDMALEAEHGRLLLSEGGARLAIDGAAQSTPTEGEYPALYRRFVELVRQGASEVDLAPLQLSADAFLCGHWRHIEPFEY